MDLRQSKPIHMKCPKCGHDFGANTNHIIQELQLQKNRVTQIKKELSELKQKGVTRNAPQYKRLRTQVDECNARIVALKNVRRNLCENAELEKYKVFYSLVKQKLGEKETVDLVKEAEDCIVYRDYDMAIQRHTNFEKA